MAVLVSAAALVFSSCGERELLTRCSAQALIAAVSLLVERGLRGAWAQQFWRTDLVALQHVGSSQTRDRTRVPCTGRQVLNHWTSREVLVSF